MPHGRLLFLSFFFTRGNVLCSRFLLRPLQHQLGRAPKAFLLSVRTGSARGVLGVFFFERPLMVLHFFSQSEVDLCSYVYISLGDRNLDVCCPDVQRVRYGVR